MTRKFHFDQIDGGDRSKIVMINEMFALNTTEKLWGLLIENPIFESMSGM
jgi:hypothetical protein